MSEDQEILHIVAAQLGRHAIRPEQRLIEDLGAESADLVNLIATLEERYGLTVGEEEAAALTTVADVMALVTERLTHDG